MCPGTRACIAYVVGRVATGAVGSYVYDFAQARHLNIGGTIRGDRIGLYDYERGCDFAGSLPHLYDHGAKADVFLEIDGNQFSGRDHRSGHGFSGGVTGSSISLHDHATSERFEYGL